MRQGYLNFKGYKEFAADNRPDGWNAWATLIISPAAPTPSETVGRMDVRANWFALPVSKCELDRLVFEIGAYLPRR